MKNKWISTLMAGGVAAILALAVGVLYQPKVTGLADAEKIELLQRVANIDFDYFGGGPIQISQTEISPIKKALDEHRFDEVIALGDRPNVSLNYQLWTGYAYLATGKYSDAHRVVNRLLKKAPLSEVFLLQSQIYDQQNLWGRALQSALKAKTVEDIGQRKSANKLRGHFVKLLLARGYVDEAKPILDSLEKISNKQGFELLAKGQWAWMAGKMELAEQSFKAAIAESADPLFYLFYGRLLNASDAERAAEAHEALAIAEQGVRAEIAGGLTGHSLELAEILIERGQKIGEALELITREENIRDTNAVKYLRAWANFKQGQYDLSIKTLSAVDSPNRAKYHHLAALGRHAVNDYSGAHQDSIKVKKMNKVFQASMWGLPDPSSINLSMDSQGI